MIKLGGLVNLKPIEEVSDSEIKKTIKKKEKGGPYTIVARNGNRIVANSPKSYEKVEDAIKMYHKLNKKHGRRHSVSIEDGYGRTVFMESIGQNKSTQLGRLLPEELIKEGTRSQVGIIDRSGKIASAYVHFDGYPSNMKPGIKKHMKNEKDVLTLIKKGGARGIFNDKDIEYYNEKSQPIKGNFKDIPKYLKNAGNKGGAEYVYLYNMKDRKWYFADVYDDKELKKLY